MEILKALANETRYEIVQILVRHDYCVRALANQLNISEPAVSQHLSVLRDAGIVEADRRGYYIHYWVDRNVLRDAANGIAKLSNVVPSTFGCHKPTFENTHSTEGREPSMTKESKCKHPDLKPRNGKCSEEQVKQCHGDEKNHPCDEENHPCDQKNHQCDEKSHHCDHKKEPCS